MYSLTIYWVSGGTCRPATSSSRLRKNGEADWPADVLLASTLSKAKVDLVVLAEHRFPLLVLELRIHESD